MVVALLGAPDFSKRQLTTEGSALREILAALFQVISAALIQSL